MLNTTLNLKQVLESVAAAVKSATACFGGGAESSQSIGEQLMVYFGTEELATLVQLGAIEDRSLALEQEPAPEKPGPEPGPEEREEPGLVDAFDSAVVSRCEKAKNELTKKATVAAEVVRVWADVLREPERARLGALARTLDGSSDASDDGADRGPVQILVCLLERRLGGCLETVVAMSPENLSAVLDLSWAAATSESLERNGVASYSVWEGATIGVEITEGVYGTIGGRWAQVTGFMEGMNKPYEHEGKLARLCLGDSSDSDSDSSDSDEPIERDDDDDDDMLLARVEWCDDGTIKDDLGGYGDVTDLVSVVAEADFVIAVSTGGFEALPADAATATVLAALLADTPVRTVGDVPLKALRDNAMAELNLLGKALSPCEAGLVTHHLGDRSNSLKAVVVNAMLTLSEGMCHDGRLDLAGRGIGQAEAALVEAVLLSKASATRVRFLNISKNPISVAGANGIGKAIAGTQIETIVFGPKSTKVEGGVKSWDLSGQDLGAVDAALVSGLVRSEKSFSKFVAALTSLNVMRNPIGDDGLANLMAAVEGTAVKSITGLVDGQTCMDWSGQGLTPMDAKILSADLTSSPFVATLAELDLSGNPAIGVATGYEDKRHPSRLISVVPPTQPGVYPEGSFVTVEGSRWGKSSMRTVIRLTSSGWMAGARLIT